MRKSVTADEVGLVIDRAVNAVKDKLEVRPSSADDGFVPAQDIVDVKGKRASATEESDEVKVTVTVSFRGEKDEDDGSSA